MARTVAETILSDNGKLQKVSKSFARGKGAEPARETREFERPTASFFKEYILALNDTATDGDESEAARAHRLYITALDREIADDVYERAAGTSTIVRIGKVQYDLMDLSLKAFIKGYTNTAGRRDDLLEVAGVDEEDRNDSKNEVVKAVERNVGWNPWRNAFTKRAERGEVKMDAAGVVVPASA